MKLMVLGTSSDAGKTLISALFCRYLHRKGYDVVPFKASNLSLNSRSTHDGKEIGMGQMFQSLACGKEPSGDMNPILLKPSNKGVIQFIINGRPYADMSPGCMPDTDMLADTAYASFDRLIEGHDAVICEGSGSPVEINRIDRDFANLRLVRERNIPAVIVGDIERGGVFAAIYGTWLLTPEQDRRFLKGFIINRFRGERSLLRSGIERLEELTGMECLGIMPYVDLRFPDEDTISSNGRLSGNDVNRAYLDNLDEMLDTARFSLDLDRMERLSSETL